MVEGFCLFVKSRKVCCGQGTRTWSHKVAKSCLGLVAAVVVGINLAEQFKRNIHSEKLFTSVSPSSVPRGSRRIHYKELVVQDI